MNFIDNFRGLKNTLSEMKLAIAYLILLRFTNRLTTMKKLDMMLLSLVEVFNGKTGSKTRK